MHKDGIGADTRVLEGETTAKRMELIRLQREVTSSKEALEFYNKFKETGASADSTYRKDSVRDILSIIKDESNVNKILFTMDPFVELEEPNDRRKNAVLIQTEMKIQFTAVDDLHVQRLLSLIENNFPGNVYYTLFKIEKTRNITDAILLEISKGKLPDLVTGEIHLKWKGIKELITEGENALNL